jgi:hypothetical protein
MKSKTEKIRKRKRDTVLTWADFTYGWPINSTAWPSPSPPPRAPPRHRGPTGIRLSRAHSLLSPLIAGARTPGLVVVNSSLELRANGGAVREILGQGGAWILWPRRTYKPIGHAACL